MVYIFFVPDSFVQKKQQKTINVFHGIACFQKRRNWGCKFILRNGRYLDMICSYLRREGFPTKVWFTLYKKKYVSQNQMRKLGR